MTDSSLLASDMAANSIEDSAEGRLEQLLTTHPAAAEGERATLSGPLILYGAGTLGRTALAGLRAQGVEPAAFVDDTPGKDGTTVEHVAVMSAAAALERFGEEAVFAVTILNPRLPYLEARRRLRSQGCRQVISFVELARTFPRTLLPHYQYQRAEEVLAQADEIRRGFRIWADDESRRQFAAHVAFRLHADYEALPPPSGETYFPSDVPLPLTDETIFVDCGAYDGDTIRRFLASRHGRFREIDAFEPDTQNCRKLREFVNTLEGEAARRIHVFNAAVGRRRERLRFQSTGDMAASFSQDGGVEVDVLPIDEVVAAEAGDCVYVKYDVEGAELDALKGTAQLIARARPTLAVSIYHRPHDLWELPLYLASLDAGYRLFLRTEGADGMDLICYAVPAGC